MPCDPYSIDINIPDGPAGPTIPGFGIPLPILMPDLDIKAEVPDLNFLFNLLSLLTPVGPLKSPLNPNYGRDILDEIIKLLDMLLPYLMLYKFFLPLLKLILCVLEIVCALPNPRKTARAVRKLFRECIPLFFNLFPIFALIMLIIAILLLILQILAYLLLLILTIIALIIKNIKTLIKALDYRQTNANAILAVARKLGVVLCLLQNLFVVFLMIEFIISIFKDMLGMMFNLPPCDNSDSECCSSDVCPIFLKSPEISNNSGNLLCISQVNSQFSPVMPEPTQVVRSQSFQFYDEGQTDIYKQFINMIAARDITTRPYPIFYPTESTFTGETPPEQAPYTVDMILFYNPALWNRTQPADGSARYIIFKDCIVVSPTAATLINDQNSSFPMPSGALLLSGGKGYEYDGYNATTILYGYDSSNPQQHTTEQATLNNFLFLPESTLIPPNNALPTDGKMFTGVNYTFKINFEVLVGASLTTYGCDPAVAAEKAFTNTGYTDEANEAISALQNFPFPDVAGAKDCAFLAIDGLRVPGNLTEEYVTNVFQPTILGCLQNLNNQTKQALQDIINIGYNQYNSTVSADLTTQFTTFPIKIKVDLRTTDNNSMIQGLPTDVAEQIATSIIPTISFGDISNFIYDGTAYFIADLTSKIAGSGKLTVQFNNKTFSNINVPTNIDEPRTITFKEIDYNFIYTPVAGAVTQVGIGDTSDGQPRRDEGDVSRSGGIDGGN